MKIYEISAGKIKIPQALETVAAGFPSPAAGYIEDKIDLTQTLIKNIEATFLVRVSGDSMQDANIASDDILIVDKSLLAKHGNIIIAVLNGEFTVKTLYNRNGIIKLVPANSAYPEIVLSNEQELKVWGVVTYIIHKT